MKNRPEHLASEISKILASDVQADFKDSIVTISDVVVTRDLMFVSVWIKILGENVFGDVIRRKSHYRETLAKRLKLRKVPDIKFIADKTSFPK